MESTATVETEAPSATSPVEDPAEKKERRGNGALETQIKAVTDAFVQGVIDTGGAPLTPYRIAKFVQEKFPDGGKTSTGAVTECLKRWRDYGFCTLASGDDTPMAFAGYTDEARSKGLKALKAEHRERNKAIKRAAKAEAAEATPVSPIHPAEGDAGWEYPDKDSAGES
jgi:hypothetical protein